MPIPGVPNIKEEPQEVNTASTSLIDPLASRQAAGPSVRMDEGPHLQAGQPASGSMNAASANMSRSDSNQNKMKGKETASGRDTLGNLSRMCVSSRALFTAVADVCAENGTSLPQQISRPVHDPLDWHRSSRPNTMPGCSNPTTTSRATNGSYDGWRVVERHPKPTAQQAASLRVRQGAMPGESSP